MAHIECCQDASREIMAAALGPKVYECCLLWAIWIPRVDLGFGGSIFYSA